MAGASTFGRSKLLFGFESTDAGLRFVNRSDLFRNDRPHFGERGDLLRM
jgi:hypothetical protein